MGLQTFDQFTYLHFASGILAYFWGIPFILWVVLHTIFEIMENTEFGMKLINKYIFFWPGNKPYKDSVNNIIGDTLGTIVGWVSAYLLDRFGAKMGWYKKHLN